MINKKRVIFLDCVRAICMIWIIGVWHMQEYTNFNLVDVFYSNITTGVLATFTFISGYFLGEKDITDISDIINFYKKRLLRLYPLFFLSCTSFLILYIFWKIKYISSISQYFLTLLGLSCIITPAPQTIWYVSMLIFLYLITPLILYRKDTTKKIITIIIIYIFFIILKLYFFEIDSRVLIYSPFYFVGLCMSEKIKFSNIPNVWTLMLSMCFFVLLNKQNIFNFSIFLKIITSSCFIALIFEIGKIFEKCKLIANILKYVSYSSMCSYLFHRQYFGIMYKILGAFNIWMAYIFIVPSLIIGSYFIQKIYDIILQKIIK